ncbi:MAG: glucosaminidase domain-containing protein [Candidatus Pacearchaeota archaeon]|nr:glucosaminidase domain-containing protein [Candidatus Pacearchaeota archaeon]
MKNKILVFFVIFFFFILVKAEEQKQEIPPLPPYFNPSYGFDPTVTIPWSKDYCNKTGMDFIVIATPEACEPNPVRSDILEEEDVPVMCRLIAIKINPLIQVPYIKRIDLTTENKSPEIFNVAFFPARAAFSYYDYKIGKKTKELEGYPSMNNLGYLMIQLRKQPIEAKMPEKVVANLNLRITYDAMRTFGISEHRIVLKKMNDDEWKKQYRRYGFWNGKGYVRLMKTIGTNKAEIALYVSPYAKPLWQGILSEGEETEEEIKKLPQFYCEVGPILKLEKISTPEVRARMIVNGNELLLGQNDNILDSDCRISEIIPSTYSHAGKVEIRCFGEKPKILSIDEVQAELKINEEKKIYSLGEKIEINKKYFYLGFAGKSYRGGKTHKFVILYKSKKEEIKETTREKISRILHEIHRERTEEGKSISDMPPKEIEEEIKKRDKLLKDAFEEIKIIEGSETIENTNVKLLDVLGHVDFTYSKEVEKAIEEAISRYQDIANAYPTLENREGNFYGIIALKKAASLYGFFDKREKQKHILTKLIDKYAESENLLASEEAKNARILLSSISAGNGKTSTALVTRKGIYFIQLLSVERPGIEALNAHLRINGTTVKMGIDDFIDNWYIAEIKEDSIVLRERTTQKEESLRKGDVKYFNETRVELLSTEINLEASIVVSPRESDRVTETNFSVAIGIEKRAIQLSPEKIRGLINNLNKTINSLEKINKNLGKIVSAWKKACFVGGTALWAKNFVSGLGGESFARRKVMEKWKKFCEEKEKEIIKKYFPKKLDIPLSSCYKLKEKEIEKDIDLYKQVIKKTNDYISKIKKQEGVISKGGLFGLTQFINEDKFMEFAKKEFPAELEIEIKGKCKEAGGEWKNECNENEIDYKEALDLDSAEKKCCIRKDLEPTIKVSKIKERIEELYEEGKLYRDQLMNIVSELYLFVECKKKVIDYESVICKKTEEDIYGILKPLHDFVYIPSRKDLASKFPKLKNLLETPYSSFSLTEISLREMPVEKGNIREVTDNPECPNETHYFTIGITTEGRTLLILENRGENHYAIIKGYVFKGEKINCMEELKVEKLGIKNTIIVAIDPKECGNNRMIDPEIKFWEKGPYEGLIALMPIIPQSGWYLATQSYTGLEGELSAYKASGDLKTFWVCNVGPDGKVDFDFNKGPKDKCCTLVSFAIETQIIPPFDASGSKDLIERIKECARNAKQEYEKRKKTIDTGRCGVYKLGKPPVLIPSLECEDFMKPSDCHLLYNLCDPVICPASRCNFGGKYYTENVIAEGVIGSLLLCLPNFDEGRGVLVPICLSGLHNGLDFLNSIIKAYRDCLQEQLESGKTVGICDELHSFYVCDFLWHNMGPLLRYGIPEITAPLKGGGEYASFSESWKNMIQSLDYFTQVYAPKTIQAFREKSTQQIGKEVCKRFISIVYPSPGKFLEEISKPEIYPTAFATLQEIPGTGITPQSHYKIFYIIKAGDRGIYYSVYLRSPAKPGFYEIPEQYFLPPPATGYLPAGKTIAETPDFFAPSGYKEICIRIDGKDYCDFGTVSTSFAIEELQNIYLRHQLKREIKTTKECIAGTPSIIPVATLNLQHILQEGISPALYRRGIERICSSRDPDEGTGEDRYKRIGYCDNPEIGCWLDMESVNRTISDLKIRQDVINYSQEKDYVYVMEVLGLDHPHVTENNLTEIEKEIISLENEFEKEFENLLKKKKEGEEIDGNYKKVINEKNNKIKGLTETLQRIIERAYETEHKARAELYLATVLELRAKFLGAAEKIRLEIQKEKIIEKEIEEEKQVEQNFAVGTVVFSEMKKNNYDITEKQIEEYLRTKNIPDSPFKKNTNEYAEWFYEYGTQYDIDPAFAIAVAAHESNWGRSELAKNKKNLFGIKKGEYKSYHSHEESIKDFYELINTKYVKGSYNQKTPAQIICFKDNKYKPKDFGGHCYCTNEPEKPKNTGCPKWLENVIKIRSEIQEAAKRGEISVSSMECSQRIVEIARKGLDCDYELGAPLIENQEPNCKNEPKTKFDCGSFVYWVYNYYAHKYNDPSMKIKERTASKIAENYGILVSDKLGSNARLEINKLQPGDLLFFRGAEPKGPYEIGHVAIYAGNNKIIHAKNKEKGVVEEDLNDYDPQGIKFRGAKRLCKEIMPREGLKCIADSASECKAVKGCWWDSYNKECKKCPEECEGQRTGFLGFGKGIYFRTKEDCEEQARDQCNLECLFVEVKEEKCYSIEKLTAKEISLKMTTIDTLSIKELEKLKSIIENNKIIGLNFKQRQLQKIDARLQQLQQKIEKVFLVSSVNNGIFNEKDKLVNFSDKVKICAVLQTPEKRFSAKEVAEKNTFGIEEWKGQHPEFKWYKIVPEARSYDGEKVREGEEIITYSDNLISSNDWCIEAETKEGSYWYRVEIKLNNKQYFSPGTPEDLQGKIGESCGNNNKNYYCGIEGVLRVSRKSSHPNKFIATIESFKNVPFIAPTPFIRKDTKNYSLTQLYKGMECNTLIAAAYELAYNTALQWEVHDKIENFINRFGKINQKPESVSNLAGYDLEVGDILFLYNAETKKHEHSIVISKIVEDRSLENEIIYTASGCSGSGQKKEKGVTVISEGNICKTVLRRYNTAYATLVKLRAIS